MLQWDSFQIIVSFNYQAKIPRSCFVKQLTALEKIAFVVNCAVFKCAKAFAVNSPRPSFRPAIFPAIKVIP